jgi:hypothetical protein
MSPRHLLFTLAAACHLALVACGAAHYFPVSTAGPLRGPLALYGALSGSQSGYGFFAPSVASQLRIRFTFKDRDGREWADTLGDGANREVDLRVGSLLSIFAFPHLRTPVATSLAGTMLARHPDAVQITVHLDQYILPPPSAYSAGHQPYWREVYVGTFGYRSAPFASKGGPQS